MKEELMCWNCKQSFIPDYEYEFPNCMIYWHKCPDGSMTSVSKTKAQRQPNYCNPETHNPIEQFNRKLREFYNYGTPERKPFEDDFNEQPNLEDF